MKLNILVKLSWQERGFVLVLSFAFAGSLCVVTRIWGIVVMVPKIDN